jgi:hypothetical protein
VSSDFDQWFSITSPKDELDPGGYYPASWTRFFHEMFDRHGPLTREEFDVEWHRRRIELARDGVARALPDVLTTTALKPSIEVRWDPEFELIIAVDEGYQTPVMESMYAPEATCEVAEYIRDWVVEELWNVWPLCHDHNYGLYVESHDGDAVWYCRTAEHVVAPVGRLGL